MSWTPSPDPLGFFRQFSALFFGITQAGGRPGKGRPPGKFGRRQVIESRVRTTLNVQLGKILATANPFDSRHEEYFEKRTALKMADRLSGLRKLLIIWQRQRGRCPICCERITTETGWDLHHIVQKVDGGSDDSSNLCLLHPACHRQGHNSGFTFVLPVGPDNPTSCDSSRVP
jgi:hypothetical protein